MSTYKSKDKASFRHSKSGSGSSKGRQSTRLQESTDTPETEHSEVTHLCISEHEHGQRVDNYLLKRLKNIPKSKIYQIIRKGEVRVDKKRVKPASKLQQGQSIRIPPLRSTHTESDQLAGQLKLDKHQAQMSRIEDAILYEDEHILVINKPAGLAVHGGSGISLGLIELLRGSRKPDDFLELVHRLDKETSGCIVLAKRGAILRELHQLIRDGAVEKHYYALLSGRWKGARHKIEAPLHKMHLASGERIVRVSREGKASLTVFEVKERFAGATLVDAHLLTGRTHQIRVHSQFAGHPILGDEKYGLPEQNELFQAKGLKRMFLHAHSLCLPLSVYSQPLQIEAPLSEDLQNCLSVLRAENRKH